MNTSISQMASFNTYLTKHVKTMKKKFLFAKLFRFFFLFLFSVPIFVFLVEHNMYCLFITLSCCYLLTIDNDFSSPLS